MLHKQTLVHATMLSYCNHNGNFTYHENDSNLSCYTMKINSALYLASLAILMFGCIKPIDNVVPIVTLTEVTDITTSAAKSGGEITFDGGAKITNRGVCWSINQNPTILDSKTSIETGSNVFTSSITGLAPGVTYNIRAYATSASGTGYSASLTFTTMVADIDGNLYHAVAIGKQVWMVEDLNVTHYRNGDPLSTHIAYNDIQGAYIRESYSTLFSPKTYNWTAVIDNRKIAPEGWHIPTYADWKTLATFLGGESVAGGKLKEAGTTHWPSPNTGATNESGFTALPNQISVPAGSPDFNMNGYWWSSSVDETSGNVLIASLFFESTYLSLGQIDMLEFSNSIYMAVRCIKD